MVYGWEMYYGDFNMQIFGVLLLDKRMDLFVFEVIKFGIFFVEFVISNWGGDKFKIIYLIIYFMFGMMFLVFDM